MIVPVLAIAPYAAQHQRQTLSRQGIMHTSSFQEGKFVILALHTGASTGRGNLHMMDRRFSRRRSLNQDQDRLN